MAGPILLLRCFYILLVAQMFFSPCNDHFRWDLLFHCPGVCYGWKPKWVGLNHSKSCHGREKPKVLGSMVPNSPEEIAGAKMASQVFSAVAATRYHCWTHCGVDCCTASSCLCWGGWPPDAGKPVDPGASVSVLPKCSHLVQLVDMMLHVSVSDVAEGDCFGLSIYVVVEWVPKPS